MSLSAKESINILEQAKDEFVQQVFETQEERDAWLIRIGYKVAEDRMWATLSEAAINY